jgi:hypothetical protein
MTDFVSGLRPTSASGGGKRLQHNRSKSGDRAVCVQFGAGDEGR